MDRQQLIACVQAGKVPRELGILYDLRDLQSELIRTVTLLEGLPTICKEQDLFIGKLYETIEQVESEIDKQ